MLREGRTRFEISRGKTIAMHPLLQPLLRQVPTVAQVPNRAVLAVVGSQASEFLNGILASAIHEPIKGPRFSTFLHAQAGTFF